MFCKKYRQCQSQIHNDCHQVMENYYKFKSYGTNYFICPTCQVAETCTYEDFYKKHVNHLGSFKASKKSVFVNCINKVNIGQNDDQEIMTRNQQINPVNPTIQVNRPVPSVQVNPSVQVPAVSANPQVPAIPVNPQVPANVPAKRKACPIRTSAKKITCNYQKTTTIMKDNHVEICIDVSNENVTEITPTSNLIERICQEAE